MATTALSSARREELILPSVDIAVSRVEEPLDAPGRHAIACVSYERHPHPVRVPHVPQ
jgi:hypothetical protein